MNNLNIRAIETNENIKKIIENGFVPGELFAFGKKLKIKIESKKLKRLFKYYSTNDLVKIKYNGKLIDCTIRYFKINELNFVETIVFDQVVIDNLNTKNVPLVFEGDKYLFDQNKKLQVLLTELEVMGDNLPEYIKINLKDFMYKQKLTVRSLREYLNMKILNHNDEVVANIITKGNFAFAS